MTMPEEVLDFWFEEPPTTREELFTKVRRWFQGGPEMDAEVNERFGQAVERALAGEFDDWADEPRSRLALVLVLDQFTRNTFRGEPRTHDGDAKAQQLSLEAFDRGMDAGLTHIEKMFLAMPLLHAEDLAIQRRSDEIAARLAGEASGLDEMAAASHLEQSLKYTAVIERFGRFPHRNALLGRTSTPEEEEFLKDWAQTAPPKQFQPNG